MFPYCTYILTSSSLQRKNMDNQLVKTATFLSFSLWHHVCSHQVHISDPFTGFKSQFGAIYGANVGLIGWRATVLISASKTGGCPLEMRRLLLSAPVWNQVFIVSKMTKNLRKLHMCLMRWKAWQAQSSQLLHYWEQYSGLWTTVNSEVSTLDLLMII